MSVLRLTVLALRMGQASGSRPDEAFLLLRTPERVDSLHSGLDERNKLAMVIELCHYIITYSSIHLSMGVYTNVGPVRTSDVFLS
jgi:hypothetical protein